MAAKNKSSSKLSALKTPNKKRKEKDPTSLNDRQVEEVVVEHQEYGVRLAWCFLKGWQVRMPPDEVSSIVGMALVEAARRFDPSKKVAYKTFFFYHLRGMLLKEIARLVHQNKIRDLVPDTSFKGIQEAATTHQGASWALHSVERKTPEAALEQQQLADICNQACDALDELEREVVRRHYVNDEPLKKVAKDLGYNRCHISRVKSKALSKLHASLGTLLPKIEQKAKEAPTQKKREPNAAPSREYTGGRGRRKIPSRRGNEKRGQAEILRMTGTD